MCSSDLAVLQPAAIAETALDVLVFAFQRAAILDADQRMALVLPEPIAGVARVIAGVAMVIAGVARVAAIRAPVIATR